MRSMLVGKETSISYLLEGKAFSMNTLNLVKTFSCTQEVVSITGH